MDASQTNYFLRSPKVGYLAASALLIGAVLAFAFGPAVWDPWVVILISGAIALLTGIRVFGGARLNRGPTIIANERGVVIRPRFEALELSWDDISDIKVIAAPLASVAYVVTDSTALLSRLPTKSAVSVEHCLKRHGVVALVDTYFSNRTPDVIVGELSMLRKQYRSL